MRILGVTKGYRGLQGVTQGYKRVTRGYRELKELTGSYKGLQGLQGLTIHAYIVKKGLFSKENVTKYFFSVCFFIKRNVNKI